MFKNIINFNFRLSELHKGKVPVRSEMQRVSTSELKKWQPYDKYLSKRAAHVSCSCGPEWHLQCSTFYIRKISDIQFIQFQQYKMKDYKLHRPSSHSNAVVLKYMQEPACSSVSIAIGYLLGGRNSISGREQNISILFSVHTGSWAHTSCCPVSSECLSRVYGGQDVKLSIHIRLVPKSRMVELYLHSSPCLYGLRLNGLWLETI
jgi:hypothetical protein